MIKKMIRVSAVLLLLLEGRSAMAQGIPGHERADSILQHLKQADNYVLVAVHRGDWRNYPENSLAAIQGAIAMKADIVEIDIQRTRDGKLVLMHDKTVDRTTNGSGPVSGFTLDSIKTLFLKNGLGRVTLFPVPTLEEAMRTAKGRILVNLDKCYDFFPEAHVILQKTNTLPYAILKGERPAPEVEKDLGKLLADFQYMPIIDLAKKQAAQNIQQHIEQLKPLAIEFIFNSDTLPLLSALTGINKNGTRVWINSLWESLNGGHDDDRALIDPDNTYGWLLRKGATIIQTDRPQLLLNYLRGLHRHE